MKGRGTRGHLPTRRFGKPFLTVSLGVSKLRACSTGLTATFHSHFNISQSHLFLSTLALGGPTKTSNQMLDIYFKVFDVQVRERNGVHFSRGDVDCILFQEETLKHTICPKDCCPVKTAFETAQSQVFHESFLPRGPSLSSPPDVC